MFREKFQAVKTTQTMKDQCLTITESNMHPDTMEQILEYLYSNDCKFLKDGEICSPHLYSETKIGNKRDNVNFGIDVPPDIVASTLETCDLVPSSLKLPKNLKKGRKLEFEEKKQSHLSPLKILQDAAKMFGIHCLVRR